MTAAADILTRAQLNPEITTNDAAWVTDLVARVMRTLVLACGLPRWPELSVGYSKSRAGATEDISGVSTNAFLLEVNGDGPYLIEPTLANCGTGSNTASEVQTTIRAVGSDGFDEVIVAFAATQYTVSSGRYGELSMVNVTFNETEKHVAQSMQLSPAYGGTELRGMAYDQDLEDAAVVLVEALYQGMGIENCRSGSIPGGMSFAQWDVPPFVKHVIANRTRLF
ncbi:hypothetical protein LCGC14_1105580 [marine sediment metagenome]|uniref:Uncharacterized protein n=1 Tax=marine sediment metagenome TaxID=412755 RepID=A0A0F9MCY5_9ZZZZ